MSRAWIEIQRELHTLISPIIDFQIHCADDSVNSKCGNIDLLRYWITLDEEIIWDVTTDAFAISDIICKYIDTPEDKIYTSIFDDDHDDDWGLIDILRKADRRFGISRIDAPSRKENSLAANKILDARYKASELYSFGYEFCLFLEFRISFILENCMTDTEKSGFWCDGVIFDSMLDNKTALCRAWIVKGQTEWYKFYLILHLENASSLWQGRTDFAYLKERVHNDVRADSFSIDVKRKTIHFNLN